MITLAEIEAAARRLETVVKHTPLEHLQAVSRAADRTIWVKEEQFQRTGSYKIRGAYNLISQLPADERVVAASAGNHAQGVALASVLTGHNCEVFMPARASLPKIEATEGYGAKVTLIEGDLEDCVVIAKERALEDSATFVPPFDHPMVIAGQGTIGLELARDMPEDIEAIVIPVGGGGLISGVATALKALRPEVRVIGVEAAGAPTMNRSMREGHPVKLEKTMTMADGIAMKEVSELTLDHVRHYVDELVVVTEEETSAALLMLLERAKVVVEPGAATSLAAIMAGEATGHGPVVALLSGGNVDPALLMRVIDHGLTSSGRYIAVKVITPDSPGHLAELAEIISRMGINVIDIEHHRSGHNLETDQVEILVTLETRNRTQQEEVLSAFENAGYFASLET